MPKTPEQSELELAFDEAVTLFNMGKEGYDRLIEKFDPDIILKRVDDPGSVVGIGNVSAYLKGPQATLHPRLTDEDGKSPPKERTSWVQGNQGQVRGTAQYYDHHGADPIEVRFWFCFTQRSDEEWMLANAFAAPVAPVG